MYYKVELSNWNYKSGNANGHYIHTEGGVSGLEIELSQGSMSVAGSIEEESMTDTGVYFRTQDNLDQ